MSNNPPAPPKKSFDVKSRNMIAIASGKGGVGKTWFAITLAHSLAQRDRNILLFDGDLGLANLDIQLGLTPKYDLGGVISGKISMAQAVMAYNEGGFDVIAGRSGSGSLANLPPSRLRMVADEVAQLSMKYDNVLLDLGAGIERTVRQLATYSAMCIVVVTDEPTALTDAYAFIKVTRNEQPNTAIHVVANMVNSTREGERTFNTLSKACESFLDFTPTLLGIIRRDVKVREAIRNQKPLLTRFPNSEAASDVEAISAKIRDLI